MSRRGQLCGRPSPVRDRAMVKDDEVDNMVGDSLGIEDLMEQREEWQVVRGEADNGVGAGI